MRSIEKILSPIFQEDSKYLLISSISALIIAFVSWSFVLSNQPVTVTESSSARPQYIINLWKTCGFSNTLGLSFSECPQSNKKILVYQSRPPSYLYAYYFFLKISKQPFTLESYHFYNQTLMWLMATLIGYLGFRIIRYWGLTDIQSAVIVIVSEAVFYSFPYTLQLFFYPIQEQWTIIFLLFLALIEERIIGSEKSTNLLLALRFLCFLLLSYCDIAFGALSAIVYLLIRFLITKNFIKPKIAVFQVVLPTIVGFLVHIFQLFVFKIKWPATVFVGSTFLWRSGLDGATNYVGVIQLWNLGQQSAVIRDIGVIFLLILLFMFFKVDHQISSLSAIPMFLTSLYLLIGFVFSQWTLIHYYVHDLFLITAFISLVFFVIPFLEQKINKKGVVIFIFVIAAICLVMYQYRVFAVTYPQALPEPNWKEYINFG
jgi:hypothetical protein